MHLWCFFSGMVNLNVSDGQKMLSAVFCGSQCLLPSSLALSFLTVCQLEVCIMLKQQEVCSVL